MSSSDRSLLYEKINVSNTHTKFINCSDGVMIDGATQWSPVNTCWSTITLNLLLNHRMMIGDFFEALYNAAFINAMEL